MNQLGKRLSKSILTHDLSVTETIFGIFILGLAQLSNNNLLTTSKVSDDRDGPSDDNEVVPKNWTGC